MHLMSGDVEGEGAIEGAVVGREGAGGEFDGRGEDGGRIARLEREVTELRSEVAELRSQLAQFRKQLE